METLEEGVCVLDGGERDWGLRSLALAGLRELIVSGFGLLQGLPSRLSDFFGISRIRKLKLTHVRSRQILDCMCDEIRQLNDEEMRDGLVYEAVYSAVQNGIVEVVIPLCKARPELLFRGLEEGKNIFQYAVECRQENVYSLIYGVGQRNLITTLRDNFGNSILHYAGMLSPLASKKLDRIAGAAFQMQREAMVQGGREYRGSTLGSLIFKQRWFDTP